MPRNGCAGPGPACREGGLFRVVLAQIWFSQEQITNAGRQCNSAGNAQNCAVPQARVSPLAPLLASPVSSSCGILFSESPCFLLLQEEGKRSEGIRVPPGDPLCQPPGRVLLQDGPQPMLALSAWPRSRADFNNTSGDTEPLMSQSTLFPGLAQLLPQAVCLTRPAPSARTACSGSSGFCVWSLLRTLTFPETDLSESLDRARGAGLEAGGGCRQQGEGRKHPTSVTHFPL